MSHRRIRAPGACAYAVLAVVSIGACASPSTPAQTTQTAPPPTSTPSSAPVDSTRAQPTAAVLPTAEVVLTIAAPGEGAASAVEVEQTCTRLGLVDVVARWQPSGEGDQEADVSEFANDFYAGTFASSDRLPADAAEYTWRGLAAGITYRARVRTLVSGRWIPSEAAVSPAIRCAQGDVYSP